MICELTTGDWFLKVVSEGSGRLNLIGGGSKNMLYLLFICLISWSVITLSLHSSGFVKVFSKLTCNFKVGDTTRLVPRALAATFCSSEGILYVWARWFSVVLSLVTWDISCRYVMFRCLSCFGTIIFGSILTGVFSYFGESMLWSFGVCRLRIFGLVSMIDCFD